MRDYKGFGISVVVKVFQKVLNLLGENGWNQSTVARLMHTTASRVNRALKRVGMMEEVRLRRASEPNRPTS